MPSFSPSRPITPTAFMPSTNRCVDRRCQVETGSGLAAYPSAVKKGWRGCDPNGTIDLSLARNHYLHSSRSGSPPGRELRTTATPKKTPRLFTGGRHFRPGKKIGPGAPAPADFR